MKPQKDELSRYQLTVCEPKLFEVEEKHIRGPTTDECMFKMFFLSTMTRIYENPGLGAWELRRCPKIQYLDLGYTFGNDLFCAREYV